MVKQNQAFAGGNHIDFMDISGKYVQTTVTWPAGANQYYLVTIVKTSGGGASIDASHIKVYIGNTLFTGSNVGSNDGLPINLPANLALMVGCAQNPMSNCDGGTMSQDAVPGVRSYFRVYDRALSADEIARNYAVLKRFERLNQHFTVFRRIADVVIDSEMVA